MVEAEGGGDPLASSAHGIDRADALADRSFVAGKLFIQSVMVREMAVSVSKPKFDGPNIGENTLIWHLRVRIESTTFEIVVSCLILLDMVCLVLQEEVDLSADNSAGAIVQVASLILSILFMAEMSTRFFVLLFQGALSCAFFCEAMIVFLSGADVVVNSLLSSDNQADIEAFGFLRVCRGMRILRAARAIMKALRRSGSTELVVDALSRSVAPLMFAGTIVLTLLLGMAVMVTVQVPNIVLEVESRERDLILEKFSSIVVTMTTLARATVGSMDLERVILIIFQSTSKGSWTAGLFLILLVSAVLVLNLISGGLVAGVFMSQLVFLKGDAQEQKSHEALVKYLDIAKSVDNAFHKAGFQGGACVDWGDIEPMLLKIESDVAEDEKAKKQRKGFKKWLSGDFTEKEATMKRMTGMESEEEGEAPDDEAEAAVSQLEAAKKGVVYQAALEAYEELSGFGPVRLEDLIICIFKHVTTAASAAAMSLSAEQNKVLSSLLDYGHNLDISIKEIRNAIGVVNSFPALAEKCKAAKDSLAELLDLEDQLVQRQKSIGELLSSEKPKTEEHKESLQELQAQSELNNELLDLEAEIAEMLDQDTIKDSEADDLIDALANDIADSLWDQLSDELRLAQQMPMIERSHESI